MELLKTDCKEKKGDCLIPKNKILSLYAKQKTTI